MRLESKLDVVKEYDGRYVWLIAMAVLIMAALAFRLAYLQLVSGSRYAELSEHNFVQERTIIPLRGRIIDADGNILADNRPAYNVFLTPAFVQDLDKTLVQLEGILNLSSEESLRVRTSAENARGLRRFREIPVKGDIARTQLAVLESKKLTLPGIGIRPGPRRDYPYGTLTSQAIGYVSRINERELRKHPDYISADTIGKKGIEKAWENDLHGSYGMERVVVDAQGRIKRGAQTEILLQGESKQMPTTGHDVILSLDLDLQKAAHKSFWGRAGGVVAMDVDTGFIKVWLSEPGFDPNKFAGGISQLDWERYRNSILDPLVDKIAQAAYYPGSTYKIIPALAALQEGVISTGWAKSCFGVKMVGNHAFHCWKRAGHGLSNLHKALRESCDVYFYNVGEMAGFDTVHDLAKRFGFGSAPGIGFNNETTGVLPDRDWHEKIHKRSWFPGDTMSHVIGQGDLKVSPLQLAVAYAALVNGGRVLVPQMVRRVRDALGRPIREYPIEIRRELKMSPEVTQPVIDGLIAVVNEQGGTARSARLENPRFGGKTGTAQVVRLSRDEQEEEPYLRLDHGWFVGFAPVEDPKIVVVAMIEHGEHGSWAAPVVRDVIAAWYEKETGQPAKYPPYIWYPPPAVEKMKKEQ